MSKEKRIFIGGVLIALTLLFVGSPLDSVAKPQPQTLNLHVPSPAWEDQIIYFIMTDRFNDGNPMNNDQGMNEFDPADGRKYSGGDLQGITDQLDYINNLGVTTIWITPPVANQWWDPMVNYGGYHGYWGLDFKSVDAHFGTLETYQVLSSGLHDRGMYLIQDIVPNHTGNFFSYEGDYNRDDPTQNFVLNVDSVPFAAPIQPPFDQNNINDPADRAADIYHWTPTITDFNSPLQLNNYQLANLDDINTSNPLVREVLKETYGYWIEEVGVDGFRVDTIIYIDHEFWNDFFESDTGIHAAAATTGRDDFFAFGEAFLGSDPYHNDNDMRVASYLGTEDAPELPSVLNFPMHFTINRVFGEGLETAAMTYRIETTLATYPNPYIIPNFIDNHDVARFLSRSNLDGLKQANMFMLTVPGIPIIYYGTEQAFTESRAAMFAEGWESGGVDHFDQESDMYQYLQSLTQLRTDNPIFSRGSIDVLADDPDSPGLFIYQREYEGDKALVVMNTADFPIFVDGVATGLPDGTVLDLMVGLNYSDNIVVGENGELTLELPARASAVLWVSDNVETVGTNDVTLTIDTDIEGQIFEGEMVISGTVTSDIAEMRLIVDGNARTAVSFSPDAEGNWEAAFPISVLEAGVDHQVVIYVPEVNYVSEPYTFQVTAALSGVRGHVDDPAGDARGPTGDYDLPTDATFTNQLDMLGVDAAADGPNLVVSVRMTGISDVWGPANGFDHVLFHVFIDFPNDAGATVLPMINADAPDGFAWDYMAFIEGWNNRLYSAEGASADNYGTSVTPLADISVDEATRTITFSFDGAALGSPTSYEGVQIYITTWDWDGPVSQYRGLLPEAGQWNFGGGEGATDPLILDSTTVFTLESAAPPQPQASAVDEAGDDSGLDGNYSYPTDETFGSQMDILGVEAITDGPNLQVTAIMSEITDDWGPVNGFDHVMFHVFIDFPNNAGATVLPLLNTDAPDGFAWDYLAFIEGWNIRLYSADGASADNYGATVTPLPEVSTDMEASTVTFTFDGGSLGSPISYEGVQIYITTWDWDGPVSTYRGLSSAAGQWSFGGGDGTTDPLIMDASPVITLILERFAPVPRPDPNAQADEGDGEDTHPAVNLPDDQPPAVSLPGTFNLALGCESEWMPDCEAAQMTFDIGDYLWEATFDLPAGTYEYKVAINNSWDENYGAHAEANGENITLVLAEDSTVSFYYDHTTHWVTDSVNSIIANVPGNFQDQVGCPTWAPECLRTWLQDPDGDGIYVFRTDQIAPGDYEAKVAVNQDWTINFGVNGEQDGANILFTVGESDTVVEFVFDSETGLLDIRTGDSE